MTTLLVHATLIDTDAIVLRYYPGSKIVHHELRRFVHGKEFRDVLAKGLELFEQGKATKWLSDDRGNGPVTPADERWISTSWAPRVVAAGWKQWAVVLPKKAFGQMNMERWIALYARKGVTVRAFTEPSPAMAWLVGA